MRSVDSLPSAAPPLPPQDKCGVMPGLQKLCYAGKNFEDPDRPLEQCVRPPPPAPCARQTAEL